MIVAYSKNVLEFLKKCNVDVGDVVEFYFAGKMMKGKIMPKGDFGDPDALVIKLSNGYNVGINYNRLESLRKVEVKEREEKAVKGNEKNKEESEVRSSGSEEKMNEKPVIEILHTGGTIASKVDYETGGVIAKFKPEEILELFPELREVAIIKSRLITNALSESLRFKHYNRFIDEIVNSINEGCDGIILTHGTDTMAYSSAAISFGIENLKRPVVLVGAQRSSDRPSSDAGFNLLSAAFFIANTDFCDVAICMHATTNDDYCHILPGCKTRKMHSSARYAFKPINALPIARVFPKNGKIEFVSDYKKRRDVENKEMKVMHFDDSLKIGILKSHPNMLPEEIEVYEGFDGLVIEGTGLGHLGIEVFDEYSKENEKVYKALKNVVDSGTVVVMTTQTLYGRVNMNVYSTGRKLQKIGVLGNLTDILPEVAFIKLAFLLSNYDKKDIPKLWEKNMRGELSSRSSVLY